MGDKYAVRTIRLCEKDCLCLYVCSTGASDTENSVIDKDKCIGCGACAEACPAGAISLVPREYPPQQKKTEQVIATLRQLVSSKTEQEQMASGLPGTLAEAIARSNRVMAEDLIREAGYMLPQSGNANEVLTSLLKQFADTPGFPREDAQFLLNTISFNEPKKKEEQTMETWKCTVCGYIHEGPLTGDFICPRCKQPASKFVKVEPETPKKNPYAGTQTEKNLETAFAGESQARNKYTYFASRAKKDGFEQIAALFLKTADNEKEHAKMWFKELNGIGDMNGPICTRASPLPRKKRGSLPWPPSSAPWLPLKSTMKSAIGRCLKTWRCRKCSRRARSRCGNAATAATSWLAPRRRRYARYAPIPRATLK